jgi:hypothetical protein
MSKEALKRLQKCLQVEYVSAGLMSGELTAQIKAAQLAADPGRLIGSPDLDLAELTPPGPTLRYGTPASTPCVQGGRLVGPAVSYPEDRS